MPYIETTDEIPIFYLDEGPRANSGIFLIHAEPFNVKFWGKNIPALSKKFRVVAMDIRGRGESGKTDQGHNLTQFARDFRHMLDVLGLEKVVAVGWSIGGSILWSYMEQFGDDHLAGYVNVDQRVAQIVSEEELPNILSTIKANRLRHQRAFVLKMLGPEAKVDEDIFKWMVYECMKTPTSTYCTALEEASHSDWRPFLPNVKVPTQVYWAKYGGIDAEMAKLMNNSMPNSQLLYFEHSGHLLNWTEAEKFNREMLSFAEKVLTPKKE